MCVVENNPSFKLQSRLKRIDDIVHAVINIYNDMQVLCRTDKNLALNGLILASAPLC